MILIVDDKAENIYSLKRLLEINNFEVDTALSGEEALKKVLRTTYALMILDVQMPGMDGFEVAETLSGYSKAKDMPIIFLSAVSTDKKFIKKGYFSGGIDYVAKPVDPDILLLKVKTFYRLYEQTRELHDIQAVLRKEIEVRKLAENEQHRRAQELQLILESMSPIAFTANAQGVIEYVNEQWYRYSDDKNIFPQTIPGSTPVREYWNMMLTSKKALTAEINIRKLEDDTFRYHLLKVSPVKENGSIVKWVGTFADIHEQKLIAEIMEQKVIDRTKELREMNDALEASNTDLQQFASVASHDLKEPLRKILVFSSIVRERYADSVDPGLMSYIDKIIASSERMTKLINDLLAFSRLSIGSMFQRTEISNIINSILVDLEILIREKEAVIIVDDIPELDAIPSQIRQVFQNLISNALKFSKESMPPRIHIHAERVADKSVDAPKDVNGPFVRITVADNGIGFNEVYLDKIFTIFQRLNPKESYEGTGIGLAIAKKIVDKHNGIISARSSVNNGATFIIILPLKQQSETTENN